MTLKMIGWVLYVLAMVALLHCLWVADRAMHGQIYVVCASSLAAGIFLGWHEGRTEKKQQITDIEVSCESMKKQIDDALAEQRCRDAIARIGGSK